MPIMALTQKESVFLQCARMILANQCPPERKHYLCMSQEDYIEDCTMCWSNYLWGLSTGSIDPYMVKRDVVGAAV